LTEEEKRAIRVRFKATGNFQIVADEFGVATFRVGMLCRAEKAEMIAERKKQEQTLEDAEVSIATFDPPEDEEIF